MAIAKSVAVLIVSLAIAHAGHAQLSTNTLTYQGVLTQNGAPIANGRYPLSFKIYDVPVGGNPIETVVVQTDVVQGRFAAQVPVTPASFGGTNRWWSVTLNGVEMERQKVASVPYSLRSRWADEADSARTLDGPWANLAWYGQTPYIDLITTPDRDFDYRISVQSPSDPRLVISSDIQPECLVIRRNGWIGIGTALPTNALEVRGDIEASGTGSFRVLTIRGADIAERFNISTNSLPRVEEPCMMPLPGMVVSIEPQRAGNLAVSTLPYDKKVAGVISGANGLSVGAVLGQGNPDKLIDGEHPVAMTGRVWVYVDESAPGSKIEPGDRLTTSGAKPGHAMKVLDDAKAPGAVIGKAMTGVDPKSGMVLVLVNLQ